MSGPVVSHRLRPSVAVRVIDASQFGPAGPVAAGEEAASMRRPGGLVFWPPLSLAGSTAAGDGMAGLLGCDASIRTRRSGE